MSKPVRIILIAATVMLFGAAAYLHVIRADPEPAPTQQGHSHDHGAHADCDHNH